MSAWPVTPRPGTADDVVFAEVWDEDVYRMSEYGHQLTGRPVLDLGANVGAFTLKALDLGASHVHAVEPHPSNFAQLRINTAAHAERVSYWPVAVVGRGGPETLRLADGDPEYPTISYQTTADAGTGVEVGTIDLEALLVQEDVWGCVKCDIEGGEYDAFRAVAPELMSRVHVVVLEFHGPGMGQHCSWIEGGSLGALVETLTETHHVQTMGRASVGGQIWAWRY